MRDAFIAVLCLAGLAVVVQTARLNLARETAANLSESLENEREINKAANEAAAVYRAHIDRLQRSEADWAALQNDLQTMEGRDAPLSDHLRSVAGRLWPATP